MYLYPNVPIWLLLRVILQVQQGTESHIFMHTASYSERQQQHQLKIFKISKLFSRVYVPTYLQCKTTTCETCSFQTASFTPSSSFLSISQITSVRQAIQPCCQDLR